MLADRVKETSTTTGTGTISLLGAVSNFITFVSGIGDANTCYYAIVHQTLNEWEVGIGTVADLATDTLSRDTILGSSNANAVVNLSAGTKDVFVTIAADKVLLANSNMAPKYNMVIPTGTGSIVPDQYEIVNTYTTEIKNNAVLEIT